MLVSLVYVEPITICIIGTVAYLASHPREERALDDASTTRSQRTVHDVPYLASPQVVNSRGCSVPARRQGRGAFRGAQAGV